MSLEGQCMIPDLLPLEQLVLHWRRYRSKYGPSTRDGYNMMRYDNGTVLFKISVLVNLYILSVFLVNL
jgi:hypothetical protein